MKILSICIILLIFHDFSTYATKDQKQSYVLNFFTGISCWFSGCKENDKEQERIEKEKEELWLTDEQVINWCKEKFEAVKCWFIECPPKKKTSLKKKIERQMLKEKENLGIFEKAKKFLNAAKPQKPLIENLFNSELSPYCWLSECCNEDSIPSDTAKLTKLMYTDLYGQHLAEIVIDAISAHWNLNVKPSKALVLNFHGPVGVGKNYLAKLISTSLFKLGLSSKYVHLFNGRVHFSPQKDIHTHKENLYSWLRSNTSECSRQLFIFDDVEEIPSGILSTIKPILDYKEVVDGVDYRQTIFIFISNIGATEITRKYEELILSEKEREDMTLEEFEKVISKHALEQEGAFYNSEIIESNLVDHYIPFLPLEEEHVRDCIKHAFLTRNVKDPDPNHIDSIVESLSWIERNSSRISVNGCKNLASKVSLHTARHYKNEL